MNTKTSIATLDALDSAARDDLRCELWDVLYDRATSYRRVSTA